MKSEFVGYLLIVQGRSQKGLFDKRNHHIVNELLWRYIHIIVKVVAFHIFE
jgi:hypothetical protein